MNPLSRSGVSKGRSSSQFRHNVSRTKGANMVPPVMRGGIRF